MKPFGLYFQLKVAQVHPEEKASSGDINVAQTVRGGRQRTQSQELGRLHLPGTHYHSWAF